MPVLQNFKQLVRTFSRKVRQIANQTANPASNVLGRAMIAKDPQTLVQKLDSFLFANGSEGLHATRVRTGLGRIEPNANHPLLERPRVLPRRQPARAFSLGTGEQKLAGLSFVNLKCSHLSGAIAGPRAA